MLFVNIQNPEMLLRRIGECEGRVSYVDVRGERQDFKPIAAQLLSLSAPVRLREIPSLEVLADSPQDQARLMRCMLDANCL